MKPIHKFNNGIGATLCNRCGIIIAEKLTKDILCKKCITEQHLKNIIQSDEELGLYEEPKNHVKYINDNIEEFDKTWKEFKHNVKVIPKEEILDNRSSAYEFIDFNKQETLEEAFEKWSELQESYDKLDVLRFGAWWQQEQYSTEEKHIGHTINEFDKTYIKGFIDGYKLAQERSYSEEEVYDLLLKAIKDCYNEQLEYNYNQDYINLNGWFEKFKKK